MPFVVPQKKPKGYGEKDEESALRPRAGAVGLDAPAAAGGNPQPQGHTSVPGSQHVNIGDYLRANEGQGVTMADKLAGGLESKAAPIAGATAPLKAVAPGAAPAGVLGLGAGQGYAPPPGHAPSPPRLQGQAELDRANEVSADAKLLGTEGGKQELLSRAYGSGRSGGEADFDNALMGGGGNSRLAELSKKYSGLAERVAGRQAWTKQADEANAALADDARRLAESKAATKAAEEAELANRPGSGKSTIKRDTKLSDRPGVNKKKQSWDEYSAFDVGEALHKTATALNPLDWAADVAGIRNKGGDAGTALVRGVTGDDTIVNYSEKIDFGKVLPPGMNGPDWQRKVYDSMTDEELAEIGRWPRNDQQAWMLARVMKLAEEEKAGKTSTATTQSEGLQGQTQRGG